MRILHTSDWHLGRSLYDFSLLEDQRAMLDDLLLLLQGERADVVVIAGDIYDRPVPSAAAVQLYDDFLSRAVGQMGIPVLAVAGNHDSASRLEFGSRLYAPSGYHICGQARREIHRVTLADQHGPVDFWLIPYLHPADVRGLFPEDEVHSFDDAWRVLLHHNLPGLDPERRNVAVAHGFFSAIGNREDKALLTSDSEVNIGGMDVADVSYFAPFTYTALGHLHAPQRAGADHIRYGGSPLKYSLSEERQRKYFTLVDLTEKGVDITELPIRPLRDVRTVEGALEQLLEPSFHGNDRFGDYVFANLTGGDVLYPMEKLRKLFPFLLGLRVLEDNDGPGAPVISLGGSVPRLSPAEMFRRFYREARGHDMPEESLAFLDETVKCMEEGKAE